MTENRPDLGGERRFDAVLFDFGGVFIDSPFAATERAAAAMGVSPEALTEVVFGSYENDDDHPWHRLERGEIPFDQARAEIAVIAADAGLGEVDPLAVLAELGSASRNPRDFMVDVVREARTRGLRTSVVTNNVAEFGNFWRNLLPLDELFDDVVDSSEVKMRKPNPAIFHLACERLGVEPSRTLFVDDHPGNVAGAERAGLRAVCCGFGRDEAEVAAAEIRALIA
jgi:epoxide hydrolase-like predicted phosphatase